LLLVLEGWCSIQAELQELDSHPKNLTIFCQASGRSL
jgi:hypothetical protein